MPSEPANADSRSTPEQERAYREWYRRCGVNSFVHELAAAVAFVRSCLPELQASKEVEALSRKIAQAEATDKPPKIEYDPRDVAFSTTKSRENDILRWIQMELDDRHDEVDNELADRGIEPPDILIAVAKRLAAFTNLVKRAESQAASPSATAGETANVERDCLKKIDELLIEWATGKEKKPDATLAQVGIWVREGLRSAPSPSTGDKPLCPKCRQNTLATNPDGSMQCYRLRCSYCSAPPAPQKEDNTWINECKIKPYQPEWG